MSEKAFTGLYCDSELLRDTENAMTKTNCRTRNEFINEAIRFYIAHLNCQSNSELLTPALEGVIEAKIQDTENRLARVLFKQGVELAMMMHVIASTNNISDSNLNNLRSVCVKEVSRNSGRYSFDDAVRYQKGL